MKTKLSRLLTATKLCVSMAEVRRHTAGGIITVNGKVIPQDEICVDAGDVVRLGKHRQLTITQEVLDGLK
jgi:tyrosyl-tRNA synthetase